MADNATRIVAFTAGAFDPLHFGHVRLLADAAAQADVVVVGLHRDPSAERSSKGRPVQTVDQRSEVLLALRHVHRVVVYDTEADLLDLLQRLRPDLRVLGTDYQGKAYTGDSLGIDVLWHQRDHGFSASAYRQALADEAHAQLARAEHARAPAAWWEYLWPPTP
jgi:cytidyltransferase-like protein